MAITLNGSTGIDTPTINGTAEHVTSVTGFKNRIINGAMQIDQRNAGASGTSGAYTVDRWAYFQTQTSKGTWQQNAGSVTPPVGFTNYLGFTSSSSYSVASGDIFMFRQFIEGFNVADLAWGTANAQTVTISFWVRSSLTGTFGGSLLSGTEARSYPFTYTISSANTWQQKSITIAGDTSGTWAATNGVGIELDFGLGVGTTYSGTAGAWASASAFTATGATSVVGTSGATFYITGVQLEKGSTATSFDYRPYGTELALCQRYCLKFGGQQNYEPLGNAYCSTTTQLTTTIFPPVSMRTQPSITYSGSWQVSILNNSISAFSIATTQSTTNQIVINCTTTGVSVYGAYQPVTANNTTASMIVSAEL